jgi:hypothetical protein
MLSAFVLGAAAVIAQAAPGPASSPNPIPSPLAAPVPNVTWQTNLSGYSFKTTNPNATGALDTATGADLGSRTDYSAILVSLTRNTGYFRFGATAGEYAFPVVGQALNPTFKAGSNTDLFSFVPIAYVQYVPNGNWTITAGKMATLLGQESGFTYQNLNIQRGLAWNQEPTISRGIRATYAQGKFTGNLEYNDGYYSGRLNSWEGAAQWSASANTAVTAAFILPPGGAIPNPTAGIANKREGLLMVTQHFGKLVLTPYLQWVDSPANAPIGFTGDERAFAGVMIANYAFSDAWSLGARYESLVNRSSRLDGAANADLVGFGPGSKATTFTLTPAFKTGRTTIRGEYSSVNLGTFTPGLGFGPAGTLGSQSRLGLEIGAQL